MKISNNGTSDTWDTQFCIVLTQIKTTRRNIYIGLLLALLNDSADTYVSDGSKECLGRDFWRWCRPSHTNRCHQCTVSRPCTGPPLDMARLSIALLQVLNSFQWIKVILFDVRVPDGRQQVSQLVDRATWISVFTQLSVIRWRKFDKLVQSFDNFLPQSN